MNTGTLLGTETRSANLVAAIRESSGDSAAAQAESLLEEYAGRGRTATQVMFYAADGAMRSVLETASWSSAGYEIVHATLADIDPEAAARLGPEQIENAGIVPLVGKRALLANPSDLLAQDAVRRFLGDDWSVVASSRAEVREMVPEATRLVAQVRTAQQALSIRPAKTGAVDIKASTSATAGLADQIVHGAIDIGASDIHVEPTSQGTLVRLRVDGLLRAGDVYEADASGIVNRIKILANMDVAESQTSHDGRYTMSVAKREIDIRCVSLPSAHGESISLRLLDSSAGIKDTRELGLGPEIVLRLEALMQRSQGAVLATGPTGSGKTTTLYSMLNQVGPERKVVSIEDPIEYLVPGVSQHQVAPLRDFTFAAALRSFLRADTDVMLVGEVRDAETAQTLMEASFTGHLVLSSLHSNSAFSAPMRMVEMGASPFAVASGLSAVLNQRLLRKLCDRCKVKASASPGSPVQFTAALHGCNRCGNTGYIGRVAVGELLMVDSHIAELIASRRTVSEIRQAALAKEMPSIRDDAMRYVEQGDTSLEEVWRVIGRSED